MTKAKCEAEFYVNENDKLSDVFQFTVNVKI